MASDKAERDRNKLIRQLQEAGVSVPLNPSTWDLADLKRDNSDKLAPVSA
jgi:hypothetical protein